MEDSPANFVVSYSAIRFVNSFFLISGIIADNFADEVILEPMEIAKHYLKTFFFLDLISSLPLDYILLSVSPEANINQLVHAGLICFCPVFVTTARDTVIFLKHDRGGRSE